MRTKKRPYVDFAYLIGCCEDCGFLPGHKRHPIMTSVDNLKWSNGLDNG
jgi:hypothetical protein